MTTKYPEEEAAGIVGNVIATLDCLFALKTSGDIGALMDSTIDTLLGNSIEQLSKAFDLLTVTPTDAERNQA